MVGSGRSELPFATVEAKIQRPVYRDGLIARTRLLDALAATPTSASLILLTAPAGYGKTTVLSQWAAEDSREFAWVTVDEADGDPVRLAGHVALALHRIQPLDPAVFRALAAGDGSRHLAALAHLLTSLRNWNRPGVLVLDDVHELRNVAAMNFIRALRRRPAGGLPPRGRVPAEARLRPAAQRGPLRRVRCGVPGVHEGGGPGDPRPRRCGLLRRHRRRTGAAHRGLAGRRLSRRARHPGRVGCRPGGEHGSPGTTRTSWTTSGTSFSPGSLRRRCGS